MHVMLFRLIVYSIVRSASSVAISEWLRHRAANKERCETIKTFTSGM